MSAESWLVKLVLGIHTVEYAIAFQEDLLSFRILVIQFVQLGIRFDGTSFLGRYGFWLHVILSNVERIVTN